MALARIITRSHTCSRELALDLLARGYAVEIVSPDEIPDNLADLELRVEEDPGNQLAASVATHNGQRSASLEFLHHLKAPMGDFLRRPPEPVVMSAGTGAPPVRGESKTRQQSAASRITPLEQVPQPQQAPSPPLEPPKYFAVEEPTIPRLMEQAATKPLPRRSLRRDPAARWRWWTALAFASMAMMVLGFGFGLHRTENASAQASAAEAPEKVTAASNDASLTSPTDLEKDSEPISSAIVPARQVSPVAPAAIAAATPSTARSRAKLSRRHQDELVAPNTTTYLDKHGDPRTSARPVGKGKPAKHVARRHPSRRRHRGEVIVANKLADLDRPTRKAAK